MTATIEELKDGLLGVVLDAELLERNDLKKGDSVEVRRAEPEASKADENLEPPTEDEMTKVIESTMREYSRTMTRLA